MAFRVFALVLTFFSLQPVNTFAWGNLGHEAVAEIAEKVLSSRTKNRVKQILDGQSLSQASTWADSVRRQEEWRHTSWYHFTKVPDGASYQSFLPTLDSPIERARGDIVLALVKAENLLTNERTVQNEQKFALAFLIHLIGDIHQPFHSGRDEDKGGNQVELHWLGDETNLHSVWDSSLIRSSYPALDGLNPNDRARAYAADIDSSNNNQRRAWMRGYFDTWTDESVSARIRPYNGFDRNQEQYRSIYIEVVNRRILQAGYRLGALLNAYFDPSATNSLQGWASSSRSFDSKARAALGAAYLDRIVLKPISKADIGVQSDLSLIAEFPPDCPHDHEKIETMEF